MINKVPLFRLLVALSVVGVIAGAVVTHLPSWALKALGYAWIAILAGAAVDGWRERERTRLARRERERFPLRRSA